MRVFLFTLLAGAFLAGALAHAQAPAPREQPLSGPEAYAEALTELSQVLGGAHYLRLTCSQGRDFRWYQFMDTLMGREAARTRLLRDAFNDGFRAQRAQHPACTPAAAQMEATLRARGMRIADGLGALNGD